MQFLPSLKCLIQPKLLYIVSEARLCRFARSLTTQSSDSDSSIILSFNSSGIFFLALDSSFLIEKTILANLTSLSRPPLPCAYEKESHNL